MRVEVPRDKFLSNYEVLEHLKEVQQIHRWKFDPETKKDLSNKKYRQNHLVDLEAITRDLFSYLSKSDIKYQDDQSVTKLVTTLRKFEIEKVELLQILNFIPRNMVALYSIIEECDQRFDEKQCDEILALVNDCFPIQDDRNDNGGDLEMKDDEDDEDEFEEAHETLATS